MGVTKEIVLEILSRHFLFSINNNRVRKKYLKKQAQHIYIKKNNSKFSEQLLDLF